jgi:hypothetical protein
MLGHFTIPSDDPSRELLGENHFPEDDAYKAVVSLAHRYAAEVIHGRKTRLDSYPFFDEHRLVSAWETRDQA